ncbi:MAG: hypothetical protein V1721_01100 [Pseudomonadota bacterium]
MKKVFPLFFAILLSSCNTTTTTTMPSPTAVADQNAALAKANYGPYPENYNGLVENSIKENLKDADSAKFKYLGKPMKGWKALPSGIFFGWDVCVEVNAKNGYGGYGGYKPWHVVMRDGKVFSVTNSALSEIIPAAGVPLDCPR